MAASSAPASPPRGEPLVRRRRCRVALPQAAAGAERLEAYLALVDRPLAALLARDRLERLGDGRYLYRSRPFRLLGLTLVPTLELEARWREPWLEVASGACRLVGLGRWEGSLAFGLAARLRAEPAGIAGAEAAAGASPALVGELEVALKLAPAVPGWGRALAGRGLDQVVDRIERRLRRGLRQDALTWGLDPGVSG
ncbi:MAG: DUF1997 domain-containing protein [Synechococcaceae cyanobacterium]|nr:DUF1997 domain-containing protein [Synechococcaceae cyanobacterium]